MKRHRLPTLVLVAFAAFAMALGGRAVAPARAEEAALPDRAAPARSQNVSPSVAAGLADAAAQSPGNAGAPRFRRVFVPADRLSDWPRDAERYLPLAPAEFERLVTAAPVLSDRAAAPHLVAAEYRAYLSGDELVQGEGLLQVECPGPPGAVSLEGISLPVESAHWLRDEARPPIWGVGPDGRAALWVERSGMVQFAWSLQGRRTESRGLSFSIGLPPCPAATLTLDLPWIWIPSVNHGVVETTIGGDEGLRRWRFDFGGHQQIELTLTPEGHARPHAGPRVLRQNVDYDVSLENFALTARLQLDVYEQPLRKLEIDIDRGAALIACESLDNAWDWGAAANAAGPSRLTLVPHKPLGVGHHEITLRAVGAIQLGNRWTLPKIRVADVIWQAGAARLRVREPLTIEGLSLNGCWQTALAAVNAESRDQTAELRDDRADAAVEVLLALRQGALSIDSGAVVELTGRETTARVNLDVSVSEGQRFSLATELGPYWQVRSVEASPSELLNDWSTERIDRRRRLLRLNLAQAMTPQRPLRLSLLMQRGGPGVGRRNQLGELTPVHFGPEVLGTHLVTVHAVEPLRLIVDPADGSRRLTWSDLSPRQQQLFGEPPHGVVWQTSLLDDPVTLTLQEPRANYDGAVTLQLDVQGDQLREQYTVRIEPDSSAVDRLRVEFAPAASSRLRWRMSGVEGELRARPSPAESRAEENPRQESWDVVLPQSMQAPFELTATRELPFAAEYAVRLASLPEAANQTGAVVVRSRDRHPPTTVNHRLRPTPVEPDDPHAIAPTLLRFSYDPMRDLLAAEPALTIAPGETPIRPELLLWQCQMQCWCGPADAANQQATYLLECNGARALRLRWPAAAAPVGAEGMANQPAANQRPPMTAWVDGRRVIVTRESEAAAIWAVPLPPGRRFVRVDLQWTAPMPPLGLFGLVKPDCPQPVDLPAIASQWTLWLPPNYAPADQDPLRQTAGVPGRWLGPLARDHQEAAFNPLHARAWRSTVALGGETDRLRRRGREAIVWFGNAAAPSNAAAETPDDSTDATAVVAATGRSTPEAMDAATAEPSEAETASATLESTSATGAAGSPPTWAGALAVVAANSRGEPFLVDLAALDDLGLDGGQRMPCVADDALVSAGARLLDDADLALVVSPDMLLLTSQRRVAEWSEWLQPLGESSLWLLEGGPLAARLAAASRTRDDPVFVSGDLWSRLPARLPSLWPGETEALRATRDIRGWCAVPLDHPSGVHYVYLPLVQLAAVLAFLAAVSGGYWLLRYGAWPVVGLLITIALVAVWVDGAWAVIPTGGVLGIFAAVILQVLARRRRRAAANAQSEIGPSSAGLAESALEPPLAASTATTALQVARCLLAVAGLWLASQSHAAEPPERSSDAKASPAAPVARAAAENRVWSVLIPVDAARQPTGEKYQVPEGLYQSIESPAGTAAMEPSWLLTGAVYRGVLRPDPRDGQYRVAELEASFELRVFDSGARVRLPLDRSGVSLLPDGLTLDGRPLHADWDANGRALSFDAPRTGALRVDLRLRPLQSDAEAAQGFDLRVPPQPAARLELAVEGDAPPRIDIPSASAPRWESSPRRVVAQIGATDRLRAHWGMRDESLPRRTALDVEQLSWLDVSPASATLHARFTVNVIEGRLRELTIGLDPAWQLLPPANNVGFRVESQREWRGRESCRLVWARPQRQTTHFELSFVMSRGEGFTALDLPQIDVAGARVTRRWLAVSADPSLECTLPTMSDADRLLISEFLEAWGTTDTLPMAALRFRGVDPPGALLLRKKTAATSGEQHLSVALGDGWARLRLEAPLTTVGGQTFGCRLRTPANLTVRNVSVTLDGVEHAIRWSAVDGAVDVFFRDSLSGAYRVSVDAYAAVAVGGTSPLPLLWLDGIETREATLRIFRRSSVLAELSRTEGMTPADLSASEAEISADGRLIAAFRLAPDKSPAPLVALSLNAPKTSARQAVWIVHQADAWAARFEARMQVDEGVLDEIRLETPSNFSGPFVVDPPALLRSLDLGDGRSMLIIRPPQPIRGSYRFRLSGPIATAPGERFAAPSITLRGIDRLVRFLALPAQVDGEAVAWETRGMRSARMPWPLRPIEDAPTSAPNREAPNPEPPSSAAESSLADAGAENGAAATEAPETPPGMVSFFIVEEPSRAALGVVDNGQASPKVLQAEFVVAPRGDGTFIGVATFDVLSGSAADCPLLLPSPCRLLRLHLDGAAVALPDTLPNDWRFAVGPSRWPQRVEALFEGTIVEKEPGQERFIAPRLGDWPVARTLWRVVAPPQAVSASSGAAMAATGVEGRVDMPAWQLTRWRHLTETIEQAMDSSVPGGDDFTFWYAAWVRRAAAARQQLERSLVAAAEVRSVRQARNEIRAIEQQQWQDAEQYGVVDRLSAASTKTPVNAEASSLLARLDDRPTAEAYVFDGSRPSLTVAATAAEAADGSRRRVTLLLLLAASAAIGAWCVVRTPLGRAAADRLQRRPFWGGIAVGFAWWLWLRPSAAGLLLLLSCAAALSWSLWLERRRIARAIGQSPAGENCAPGE